MIRSLIFILIFILFSCPNYAGNPDRQGEAGAYELLMNPWARSAGLHSMTTSFIKGVEAMRLNVAGLSRIGKSEFYISNARYLEGTDIKLVIVPWSHGFGKENPFPPGLKDELETRGHCVHFGTMLFHTDELYGTKAPTLLANLLRIFGQGIKVVVEITMMACDGGRVAAKEKMIAIAGTGTGADVAVVMTAAPSLRWTKLRIHEIICKPLMEETGNE